MKLFTLIRKWLKRTFQGRKRNAEVKEEVALTSPQQNIAIQAAYESIAETSVVEESLLSNESTVTVRPPVEEVTENLPIPKEIFQTLKADFNTNKSFFPNWGDADATVSTISDGRIKKEFITRLYDEFALRYGDLTTDLGYGLIYSIVANAVEKEDRPVGSALREAIARSSDPLLCVAVVKDYCARKEIYFDKYEKITLDILKKRNEYYEAKAMTMPLTVGEREELDPSRWLFNGTITEIYPKPDTRKKPIYLMVKIPSLGVTRTIREFAKERMWIEYQNVVVQKESEDVFRILNFSNLKKRVSD